jgi:uncharacterized protein (DUF983 family)
MKHLCPHCHEECISTLQKLFIGSASSKQCKSCGKEVTISGTYTIAMIAVLLLLFIVSHVMKPDLKYILLFGSIVAIVFSLVQIYLIPLSKNKIDEFL